MAEKNSISTMPQTVQEGTIDGLLTKAGTIGVVQIAVHISVFLFGLTSVCQLGSVFFTGHSPPWKCVPSANSAFCQKHENVTFTVDMKLFNHRCYLNRTEWTYAVDLVEYSVVTEFDLVCDRTNMAALMSTLFYVGSTLGALLCGPLGDAYGRKPIIVSTIAITVITSIALGYGYRIWLLCLLQFIRGIGVASLYPVFVYLSEVSPPQFRATASNIALLCTCSSFMLMDLLAMVLQNWRKLSAYLGFLYIPSLLCFLFLPESARWLHAKERHVEAEKILSKIYQFKGDTKIEIRQDSESNTPETVYTYWHLINKLRVLKLTLSIAFIWSALPVLFYTIGAQSLNYGGNMYVNYMLASIPDIPASFIAIYLINRFGRKKTTLFCCCGSGLLIGAVALVPKSTVHRRLIILSLTVFSKLCCSVAFGGIFVWTPEIFPTVLRAQAMGICGTFEKVAMIAVPLICTLLQNISFSLPFVLMCALGVLGSVVGLVLPETKDQPTKDTYLEFLNQSSDEIGHVNNGLTGSTSI